MKIYQLYSEDYEIARLCRYKVKYTSNSSNWRSQHGPTNHQPRGDQRPTATCTSYQSSLDFCHVHKNAIFFLSFKTLVKDISLDKRWYQVNIFTSPRKHVFGYSLEGPCWGASYEYPRFLEEIKKNINTFLLEKKKK